MRSSGSTTHHRPPKVTVRGEVPDAVAAAAADQVAALAGRTHGNISAATVRLTEGVTTTEARPGRPAVAQVNLTADGRPLRVQTAASTVAEAVGLATERLLELLSTLEGSELHNLSPAPRRRPDRRWPQIRPAERKVVRRKAYPLMVQTPDEAAATLETLDYDFHLFREGIR